MRIVPRSIPLVIGLILFPSIACFGQESKKSEDHPLVPAIRYAKSCLKKVEAMPGYEATFFKNEVVGSNTIKQKMKMKVRHKPFSVYLYFENPNEGREVLYVEGKNDGKLIVHEAGLLSIAGVMELSPTDSMVMSENRYPITMAGIANAVKELIKNWEKESKYGEIEVKFFKDAKLGSLNCRVIETSHPKPRRQFDNHITRLWVDSKTGIPVRLQKYGFPKRSGDKPPIIEEYTFMDIKANVRLTDADFDRNNSKYSF